MLIAGSKDCLLKIFWWVVMSEEVRAGYKLTEVGVIPSDWDVKYLGDIGKSLIGLTYQPNNIKESGLLVLRSSNIFEERLAFEDNVYVDVDVPEKLKTKKGDILICVRNGSRELIGKCALIDDQAVGETFGAFMTVFRTPFYGYIFFQFQSDLIKRQIHENIGATINQITNKNLNSFQIPFPPNLGRTTIDRPGSLRYRCADRLIRQTDRQEARHQTGSNAATADG
jgi:type I restriction enzyme S subunit